MLSCYNFTVLTGFLLLPCVLSSSAGPETPKEKASPSAGSSATPESPRSSSTLEVKSWPERGAVCFKAPGGALALALSHDGNKVAAGGVPFRVWNVSTRKELCFGNDNQPITGFPCVAISPDGKRLATGGWRDGALRFWEIGTGKETQSLKGSRSPVCSVTISADGKTCISRHRDGSVYLWDLRTGKIVRQTTDVPGILCFTLLSPDGAVLASGTDGTRVRFWETATGKELSPIEHEEAAATCGAFSPDGRTLVLASHNNEVVWLYEMLTGKPRCRLPGHQEGVTSVSFSADGRLLAVGTPTCVRIWDLASGRVRWQVEGEKGPGLCLATFSPDGKRLAVALKETAGVLPVTTGFGRTVKHIRQPLDLENAWKDLASEDATKGYRAIWALADSSQESMTLLKARLQAARLTSAEQQRLSRLIEDLNSNLFAAREKAAADIAEYGWRAESVLRQALKGQTTLETRRRLELLLERFSTLTPAQLQALRAVELLELIDTEQARGVLEDLAEEMPVSRLSQEAKTSLSRMGNKRSSGHE